MRIDFLLKSRSGFTFENYAAKCISAVFEQRGIPYKTIYLSDGILQDYISYIGEEPPRRILSFEPLLPYEIPFCDFVGIPQFLWAKNSLSEAAHFLKSKFGTVGLPTPTELPKTVYLPHGVELRAPQKPLFDVVFFSPLVDTACLRERWNEFFTAEVIELMEAILPCTSSGISIYEKLEKAPLQLSLCHTIEAIEEYSRAERAYEVIASCRGYTLDVFGEHIGSSWYRRLPNASCVRLHAPLPFTAHFEVLSQSKLVILDPLDASWKLPAAASGCLPLMADLEDLHEQIAFYLGDSKKRRKAIESYQEDLQNQTWENQAGHLIEALYEN